MATKAPVKPTPTADDLDAALDAGGYGELDAALDELNTGTSDSDEEAIDLCGLDLASVLEMDYRPLADREWYDCEIVRAKGGRSGAGNLQVTFIYQVCGEGVDAEGMDAEGVTMKDYAGVDPRKPDNHWKIKKVAKRVGLLGPNDQLMTSNLSDFIGRRLRVQVKIDTEYNPEMPQNKVADIGFPTEPNAPFTASA